MCFSVCTGTQQKSGISKHIFWQRFTMRHWQSVIIIRQKWTMICMEESKMRVSDFIKKVTIPIVATILLFAWFYPLCVNNGGCDYLKLWILMGIPFGIHRMFVWVIPKGFDIGGTVGVWAFNFLVGGMIGGVILIWHLILAIYYLIESMMSLTLWIVRKIAAR